MKLDDLFSTLALGELSNLSICEGGVLAEAAKPKVRNAINKAMMKLYTKFIVSKNDLIIDMQMGVTNYHLLTKYAYSSADPELDREPYIRDFLGEPFREDIIKILEVYADNGQRLPLNDANQPMSVFTPQYNVLHVPKSDGRHSLSLIYQAAPWPVTQETSGDTDLIVPDVLEEALCSYIGYLMHTDMGTQESINKGQTLLARYNDGVDTATLQDLVNTSISTTDEKFHMRGFA